jgi:aminoglycoside phosphotransferase
MMAMPRHSTSCVADVIDLSRYQHSSVDHGKSDATVSRLARAGYPTLFLKTASVRLGSLLLQEKLRYDWLKGRVPVPDVVSYDVLEGEERLLLTEMTGLPSFDPSLPRDRVILRLAEGLRSFHSLPVTECPFDMTLDVKIAMAKKNAAEGRVDLNDLQPEHEGWTAEMLLAEVERLRPSAEDLVVTHGDYCLPNIIVSNDAAHISGFIDIGYCGIADRYQDLALACRSIGFNFGEEYVRPFFDAYGLAEPNYDTIAFYNLLDELF